MFYTIYKITNQINGKIYVGSHKTKDLNDDYMGSGKYLKHAQDKHGMENFLKEILFVFDTPEEMYAKEAELVNEDFIAENNTYNIKVGGFGGWDYINCTRTYDSRRDSGQLGFIASSVSVKEMYGVDRISQAPHVRLKLSVAAKRRISEGDFGCSWKGRTHSDDTKAKMSQKAKDRLSDPTKNSQFGTMWITNDQENKKIPKGDAIPIGWRVGRVMK